MHLSTSLTPTTLTLRLKHGRATTLIPVQATTPFTEIKAELLRALRQTHPSGYIYPSSATKPKQPNPAIPAPRFAVNRFSAAAADDPAAVDGASGIQIPESAEEVLLARPKDPLDAAAGWVRMCTSAAEREEEAEEVFETPKEAGLKDGAVLAFKFRSESRGGRGGGAGEDEEMDEAVDVRDVEEKAEQWDVVLPSYEDSTGVTNAGDLGVPRNYTG